MPYRNFIDSDGNDWQVWDIIPRLSEQRTAGQERRQRESLITFAERRSRTRRLITSRRAYLSGAYAHGWLCFDCEGDKRRLSPIPADWPGCSDRQLAKYLERAERVLPHRSARTDYGDSLAEAS